MLYKIVSTRVDSVELWPEFSTGQLDFNDFQTLLMALCFSRRFGHLLNNAISPVISNPEFIETDAERLLEQLKQADRLDEQGLRKLVGSLTESIGQIRDSVKMIDGSAREVLRIIRGLHLSQRIRHYVNSDTGPLTLDINDLLKGLAKDIKRGINVDIDFQVDDNPYNVTINNSPEFIVELITILLDNAQAAMDKADKKIEVSLRRTDREVVLEVKDNGIGIPESDLPLIFLPGHTVDGSPNYIKNIGMGLTVAYVIVKYMGGKIVVKSKPGIGSIFSIHIPFSDKFVLVEP